MKKLSANLDHLRIRLSKNLVRHAHSVNISTKYKDHGNGCAHPHRTDVRLPRRLHTMHGPWNIPTNLQARYDLFCVKSAVKPQPTNQPHGPWSLFGQQLWE